MKQIATRMLLAGAALTASSAAFAQEASPADYLGTGWDATFIGGLGVAVLAVIAICAGIALKLQASFKAMEKAKQAVRKV